MLNKIYLSGLVVEHPVLDHQSHGRRFYEFMLAVRRTSGTFDILRCVVGDNLVNEINAGEEITIEGDLRVYTKHLEFEKETRVYVFVLATKEYSGTDDNCLYLHGIVKSPARYRVTPSGRRITNVTLANIRDNAEKTDYLPCIIWGNDAIEASDLKMDDAVSIVGRLQSREYVKKYPDGTSKNYMTYEVSVQHFELYDGGDFYE